jgi:hypothetical protein
MGFLMFTETVSMGVAVVLGLGFSTIIVALGLMTMWKRAARPVPAPVR